MASNVLDGHAAHAHAHGHDHAHDHAHHHDAADTKVFGFWVYLMSDLIIFASLFATFCVLRGATAGGPTGKELFDLSYVAIETGILLVSSITYGMVMISLQNGRKDQVMLWLGITLLLGAAFVGMEINEFHHLIAEGAGPSRSAFLSSFFLLVGTHGLHVASGMLWIIVLMWQISRKGLTPTQSTRLSCLSLFWHFLDVVWIGVFTVVYLLGAM
ncbi:Cytochrome bo(3) ubiquinol oxidase subunit 3 [Ralstonia edaphis]|uniref:Cytochrome bo(3) ubiquinol oxidase subunit 3 n=1 Tax=Ralstonia edaphi TaxID=3058599 RepID=A0AB72X6R8_9RALS|nr:cytochrome o ubiquinol oxidase subunit III [Ralstonia sp. LMG 6871]CAJ0744546.1 Cytochrome bo(3) ubiquinol oxidase subunit 3 [Ralstonia sp. LMG 6871]